MSKFLLRHYSDPSWFVYFRAAPKSMSLSCAILLTGWNFIFRLPAGCFTKQINIFHILFSPMGGIFRPCAVIIL